jgi:lipid-A-disaccharide synthase
MSADVRRKSVDSLGIDTAEALAYVGAKAPVMAMVAGEASGDLLAALLLEGIARRWPGAESHGIGGPEMAKKGFKAWWPHHKLAVHGFGWELLRHYREIVGIRSALGDRLLGDRPDVFIGVDAPDFNLTLEERLRARGVKTVHFVCPSIWAWRPDRVHKLRQSADHVLCIFPFEAQLLAAQGIPATYVGHPLAAVIPMESDKAAARRALGLAQEDEVVALLPGSRKSEIRHLALRFFKAATLIQQARPATKFIVPAAPGLLSELRAIVARSGSSVSFQLLAGQSHTALAACDVTLIASGTATLEAALFKRPMIIAYRMSWVSWQIIRRKRLQPWVGLPNILCQDFVVPELLQEAATPASLAAEVIKILESLGSAPEKVAALQSRFRALHSELLRDTAAIATDAIEKVLEQ